MTTYWPQFLSTVVLPLITGVIISVAGWHGLKSRAASDMQTAKMEESIEQIKTNTSDLQQKEKILTHYQGILQQYEQKDEVLQRVISQYNAMESAVSKFEQYTQSPLDQRGGLSEEVLRLITTELVPIQQRSDLPNNPLILKTAKNTFRVLFSVPMRIPPRLKFIGLPNGVNGNIIENSQYGFTVVFSPLNIEVENFGFEADAEL
ncbi:MAG: hypothetical protein ACRBB4_05105 [Neptuniibacter sp.]